MTESRDATRRRVVEEYAGLARHYDRRWRRYVRDTARLALEHIRVPLRSRMLDIGCGTGELLRLVTRAGGADRVVGMDLSVPMLRMAGTKLAQGACLAAGAAGSLPFADDTFALVSCLSVLHYVDSREAALTEMHRILAPRGRLVLVEWRGDHPFCRALILWLRLRRHAPVSLVSACILRRMAGDCGFTEVSVRHERVAGFWPVMVLVACKP